MDRLSQYRNNLAECRGRRADLQKQREQLDALDAVLAEQESSLEALCAAEERWGGLESAGAIPPRRHGRPDTQVIEEILREAGQPLHVSVIVERGLERGVTFRGRKPPERVAQDKLFGSRRFVLVGSNHWGLPEWQKEPEG